MRRREALGIVLAVIPFAAQGQKLTRIGWLGLGAASGLGSLQSQVEAVRAGLRDLGYEEGKNIIIEYRWAEGRYDRLPGLAADLVRLGVDLIVTQGTPGTQAAKQATTTIPIVMAVSGDAIATGLIASLKEPGGNVTGSTFFNPELCAKRLEILKEALPSITRVALLLNPENRITGPNLQAMGITANALNLTLARFDVRTQEEFKRAFSAMSGFDAVAIIDDPMLIANIRELASLANQHRLPSIGFLDFAPVGGLIAYGADFDQIHRRAGYFVDRIIKGQKPSDIPVERATRFKFIINLKTANALGLTVPPTLLARADEVIE
jgi:putative ABC transport system substrate-binding protein